MEAIEIAKATGRPLRIAAKSGPMAAERDYLEDVFRRPSRPPGRPSSSLASSSAGARPAVRRAYASLMPGSWPEPFGLAAIEALACGTPILARRVGGLTEIIRDGIDGFLATTSPSSPTTCRMSSRSIGGRSGSRSLNGSPRAAWPTDRIAYRRVLGRESNGGDGRLVDLKTLAPTQAPKAG